MGGTAVKKWHNRKNTVAEGHEIRGECVDFPLKIGYTGSLQFSCYYLQYVPASRVARGGAVVEALRYKPEGRGWNFSLT
jgi:hypothetical protein